MHRRLPILRPSKNQDITYNAHGSHFFRLTKFPDFFKFLSYFPAFKKKFKPKNLHSFKYSLFKYSFPVICVISPDLSLTFPVCSKFTEFFWLEMPSHFSRFSTQSGNPAPFTLAEYLSLRTVFCIEILRYSYHQLILIFHYDVIDNRYVFSWF